MDEVFNEFGEVEQPDFLEEISRELTPAAQTEPRKTRSIEIGNDVVEIVAGIAASKTLGVAEMAGGGATFAEILGRKNLAKGVRVEVKDESAEIDIFIIASQGTNLGRLFREIQRNVKEAVENMTGLAVGAINVYTQGISGDDQISAAQE
jgi:uncharacterized alkaline shock family protein YloU